MGVATMGVSRVEAWYDLTTTDGLDRLAEIGVTGVRVMANSEKPRAFADSLQLSADRAREIIDAAESLGMRTTLTLWPQSRRPGDYEEMRRYIDQVGCPRVEYDVEGYCWYSGVSRDRLRDAGDALERVSEGLHVLATTYPYAMEVCRRSLPWIPEWTTQAYSQHKDRDGYSWGGRFGPRSMQELAARKDRESAHYLRECAAERHMGLAAYRQGGDGHTPYEWMAAAWDAASQHAETLCYWSAWWLTQRSFGDELQRLISERM